MSRDMQNGKCCTHIFIKRNCYCHLCSGWECDKGKEIQKDIKDSND
jgi:hypothetical protein